MTTKNIDFPPPGIHGLACKNYMTYISLVHTYMEINELNLSVIRHAAWDIYYIQYSFMPTTDLYDHQQPQADSFTLHYVMRVWGIECRWGLESLHAFVLAIY